MSRLVYVVRIPMPGQPDGYYDLCRCLSAESAVEVMRALLQSEDSAGRTLMVRVDVGFAPVGEVQ